MEISRNLYWSENPTNEFGMISGDIHIFKHLPILDLLLLYAHACQVMFAELNLPVEVFGVVDLH